MKTFKYIKSGFSLTFSNKRLWTLLYGVQLLFAMILVAPLKNGFSQFFSQNLLGEELLAGHSGTIFVEFFNYFNRVITTEMKFLPLMGLLYLAVTLFFNGGMLTLFSSGERFEKERFFAACGEYWGRMLRLFLYSLVYILLAIGLYIAVDAVLSNFKTEAEPTVVLLKAAGFVWLAFLFFLIQMAFDYAKIMAVRVNDTRMFRVSLRAWGFVFKNLGKTLGLYYTIGLIGILSFLIMAWGTNGIHAGSGFTILLILLWQQLHAVWRTGLRMAFLGAECSLFAAQ